MLSGGCTHEAAGVAVAELWDFIKAFFGAVNVIPHRLNCIIQNAVLVLLLLSKRALPLPVLPAVIG